VRILKDLAVIPFVTAQNKGVTVARLGWFSAIQENGVPWPVIETASVRRASGGRGCAKAHPYNFCSEFEGWDGNCLADLMQDAGFYGREYSTNLLFVNQKMSIR
jgi:hypothetical protein